MTNRRKSHISELDLNKYHEHHIMSINNSNHLLTGKHSGSAETLATGKKTESGGKIKRTKNHQTLWVTDFNEFLSSTADRWGPDDKNDNSYIANLQKNLNFESHREQLEQRELQEIEEQLEYDFNFYKDKTARNEDREKSPEILLKDAADQTLSRLCKMPTPYTKILERIRECYNDWFKSAKSESELKTKQLEKLTAEVSDFKEKLKDNEKELAVRDHTIEELNQELTRLRKSKKESDKKWEELKDYAEEVKQLKAKYVQFVSTLVTLFKAI